MMADAVQEDLRSVRFTTSSSCSADGCVEVGRLPGGQIAVRDSKDRSRPALIFTADEWTAFIKGARAGEFD